ncbi:TetR family transcriptional regulator [Streptomyces sp. NWU339]|uniref:TetR/AcrR family transcriptional regulator n=1 Tax=Streptomyces sp. NWU339 TaxID=2185284 RepID=UPI000D68156F|nr:TetR/AcrR family transcriptional regulator [Streptomyces sp. NWU339]PWI05649.1 TetR family transcriptional regulator [Streptomyces sp. NWU339]
MASGQSGERRPRSDTLRNRAKILDVALRHFSEHGIGTSLEAIAKDAGVGPATLYRHFPQREALLAAALHVRGEELLARRSEIERIADPDEALRQWMRVLEDYLSLFSGLPDPVISALEEGDSPLAVSCQNLIAITDELLRPAQRDGTARASVQADTLFLSALSLAWVRSAGTADSASLEALRAMTETGYASGAGRRP